MPIIFPEFIVFMYAVLLIRLGLWILETPLDILWEKHERRLLARGLEPKRNEVWEARQRRIGRGAITTGVFLLVVVGSIVTILKISGVSFDGHILTQPTAPVPTISINGHNLTQGEWDACDHDIAHCPPSVSALSQRSR